MFESEIGIAVGNAMVPQITLLAPVGELRPIACRYPDDIVSIGALGTGRITMRNLGARPAYEYQG